MNKYSIKKGQRVSVLLNHEGTTVEGIIAEELNSNNEYRILFDTGEDELYHVRDIHSFERYIVEYDDSEFLCDDFESANELALKIVDPRYLETAFVYKVDVQGCRQLLKTIHNNAGSSVDE